jgi:putative MATE family efflux protein
MDNSKKLAEQSIGKLLLQFSIPGIVGMMVNSLYTVIDRMFIGNVVGAEAISGVSLTFPISIIIMAFGMLVGIGAAACISINLGKNKKDEAEKIFGNAFTLIIITSIIVTVLGLIFINPILRSFGASNNTISYAKEFITILLFGAVLQNLGLGLNNVIRAEGNPKKAMTTMLIGGICNIILDFIFVFLMHFGIKGAAFATLISQTVNTIWVLRYFKGNESLLKLRRKNFKLQKKIVLSIFAIGMSPFAMQIAASVVNAIINIRLVSYGGDLAVGAMGIINSIATIFVMPIIGINQGLQPIVGFNYGAKKYKRVKRTLKLACIAATCFSAMGSLFIEIAPKFFVQLFNKSDINLLNITVHGMRIYMCMFFVVGFQIVSSNFFQAIGRAKISMILALSRQVIVLIPMLIILPYIFNLNGVWMAAPISDLIAAILTAIFVFKEIKKLNRDEVKIKNVDIFLECK